MEKSKITLIAILSAIIILIIILIIKAVLKKAKYNDKLVFEGKRKLPAKRKIEYYKQVPCRGNLDKIYCLAYQYRIIPEEKLKKGLISATILNWIKNNEAKIVKTKKGKLNLRNNNYAIDLSKMQKQDNNSESKILNMLKDIAGESGILEIRKFEKWCRKNYDAIESIFDDLILQQERELFNAGLIQKFSKEKKRIFNKIITSITYYKKDLKDEAIQIVGLKKYLEHYNVIKNREFVEVKQWEDYLIFAHLLGLPDKVEKQFAILSPELKMRENMFMEKISKAISKSINIGIKNMIIAEKK